MRAHLDLARQLLSDQWRHLVLGPSERLAHVTARRRYHHHQFPRLGCRRQGPSSITAVSAAAAGARRRRAQRVQGVPAEMLFVLELLSSENAAGTAQAQAPAGQPPPHILHEPARGGKPRTAAHDAGKPAVPCHPAPPRLGAGELQYQPVLWARIGRALAQSDVAARIHRRRGTRATG